MPIDGVSFSNTGFNIINPHEVNMLAEGLANKEAEKKIKEANKSDETKADSDEDEENKDRDLQGRDTQENEEQGTENRENLTEITAKDKKFLVRFNSSNEMVEMIDAKSGAVLETVSPEDLIKLLSKSKAFSGVFVDRKI